MYVCITTPYKAKVHTSYWHIPVDPVTQMTHMEWAGARKKQVMFSSTTASQLGRRGLVAHLHI